MADAARITMTGKSILKDALAKIENDKYTIDPFKYTLTSGKCSFLAGDMIDLITGDIIIGPYCVWPKLEPRIFEVTDIWLDECPQLYPTILKEHEHQRKAYQPIEPLKDFSFKDYRDSSTPRSPMKRFRKSSKR